jgi:mitochondrial fission protein ELM1
MQSCVMCEAYAGLQAQGVGLAEAAGLTPDVVILNPRRPWGWLPAASWPAPLRAVGLREPPAKLLFTVGGTAGAVGAALRRQGARIVQVQNPRMQLDRFDLVVANRHDGIKGPNVIVTRTALHRVTATRLREAAGAWRARLSHLPRPLVAVLVGGSNGRFRLGEAEGAILAAELARMMVKDQPGVIITPSRRTSPAVRAVLQRTLAPLGADIWDMQGENPYFGMLALADVIVATIDSISMVSEAVATRAPVLLADLPGRSARIRAFLDGLLHDDRVRPFAGRLQDWPVQPLDDTPWAGAEVRHRLGW